MPTRVLYHCPCSTNFTPSFGPIQPSTSSFQLPSLYFCDDCDSIRCDQCTTKELTVYYCPNCLFDVPLASIKSEHANCPRNCFSCPICSSTLGVVGSDSNEQSHWDPLSAEASTGEPPWYLQCPTCRWDSKEVKMTFEKSTGLSLQVQKIEDEAADAVEFRDLRAHFDKYLRFSTSSNETQYSMEAARASKLLRDVPSLANQPGFGVGRSKISKRKTDQDEQIPQYTAKMTWDAGRDEKRYVGVKQDLQEGKALGAIGRKEQSRLEFMQEQVDDSQITDLAQRWSAMNDQSVRKADLGPCRVPLRTKQTKRCSVCRHIIIRPESKPTSSKYKIRLLALNRLPEIFIRPPNSISTADRRRSTYATLNRRKNVIVDEENLQAGRTYLFEASFINPRDEMMMVRLHLARAPPSSNDSHAFSASSPNKGIPMSVSSRYAWSVSPTSSNFPVSAYNEVWELAEEDDEDLFEPKSEDIDEDGMGDDRDQKRSRTDVGGHREGKKRGQGILRRKGHETVIGLELSLDREAVGEIEFPMQVTFTYKPDAEVSQRGSSHASDSKSFSFWTFVRLGRVTSEGSGSGHHAQPHSSIAEARRSALDKRRSIMGMNIGGHGSAVAGQTTSTLSALRREDSKDGTVSSGSPQRPGSVASGTG
ncbi:uncharacterized protein FA14DRAFT_142568 [Meira miltonrushii]|uniref:Dynactin subunit 4 n=1 Tax=Meira miltonrushii TaxID=1280837 RepID=A0A316VJY5_9BASI|nr:uncharacterized protein FA14DRAFT_142568 [Meira miltonrushii]PWN37902.1 hypothetical protein FA14DRAFT_142568 [Meira miltonrushii]